MNHNSLDIVLRFSSLGDVVLCSGFLEKLHQQNTANKIVFATQQPFIDILSTFEHPPHKSWGLPSSSLSTFLRAWELLRTEHSQTTLQKIRIFDLHRVPKSFAFRCAALIFSLIHGIKYSSYKTSKKSFLRWLSLFLKKDFVGKRHVCAEHQKILAPKDKFYLPKLRLPVHSEEYDGDVKKILIAPDSQHWKKKWPVTYWEEFFRLAHTSLPNVEYTLVGGSDIFPMDLLDHLKETLGPRFKNRLGRLPLSDLARVASQHDLTLCGNSAWQHISESVEVPVISLPGPIIKGFGFSPFLSKSRELEVQLKCRPCTRHGGGVCHLSGDDFHACMKRITPDLLLKNTQELLKS